MFSADVCWYLAEVSHTDGNYALTSPTKNCTWLFEEVQYTHGKNTFVVYAQLLRKFILEPDAEDDDVKDAIDAMEDRGSDSSKNRHRRRKGKVGS
jgi:hypothetical protein